MSSTREEPDTISTNANNVPNKTGLCVPMVYSAQSMARLQARDEKPKEHLKVDDPRGISERGNATSFILPAPLTVAVLGAGYKVT